MANTKHPVNWNKLREEYVAGEERYVTVFLRRIFDIPEERSIPGEYSKQTKGWPDLQKKYRDEREKRAIEKLLESQSTELAEALNNMRGVFIKKAQEGNKMNVREAVELWKALRIENNMPVNITKATVKQDIEDPENGLDYFRDE